MEKSFRAVCTVTFGVTVQAGSKAQALARLPGSWRRALADLEDPEVIFAEVEEER